MFRAVEKRSLLPGFDVSQFTPLETKFSVNGKEFSVKAFWGRFKTHPLRGDRDNMGTYEETNASEGFPIMRIYADKRQFGFAFHDEKWMFWNDNATWISFMTLLNNSDFTEGLKKHTGLDAALFHKWSNLLPEKIYSSEGEGGYYGKGYGKVWVLDTLLFQKREFALRLTWNPNGDPRYFGVLSVQVPIKLPASFFAHPLIAVLFTKGILDDALQHDSFLVSHESSWKPQPQNAFAQETVRIVAENTSWKKKFVFLIQTRDGAYEVPMKAVSYFENSSSGTVGNIEVSAIFERNSQAVIPMGDALAGYLRLLLKKLLEVQLYQKGV